MKLSRRSLIALTATLPLLTPADVRAQSSLLTVRVGTVPNEQGLPYAYGIRAGLFERAGLRIENNKMNSGSAIAAAVAGNAVDIGGSSMLSLVLGHARKLPYVIVAPSGLWLPSSEGGLLVAGTSPLRAPKDFAGKTVAVASLNDIASLGMQAWLEQNAVDAKTVKFIELPQLAAPAALEQGRIDGAVLANPAYGIALDGGKARVVANVFSAISPRFLFGCWFSTNTWVASNHSAAERFSRVIAEASTYVNTHQPETVDDIVQFTGVERGIAARMKRTPFTPTLNAAEIQPLIDVAAKYKAIEKSYPAAELISDAAAK